METILVKILAVVLALSQISTRPDDVKVQFDPAADRAEVVDLLRAGCGHVRKVFEVEDLQLDDLIATALADPQAVTGEIKAFRGLNFDDLHAAYKQFCTAEKVDSADIDIGQLIGFYNRATADLPDHTRLKGMKLASPTAVLDGRAKYLTELYEPGNRRISIPLSEVPDAVQKAFVAAEDKRFYQHRGIDERGLVRAFVANMVQPGRPQGGSTITQQVVKNVLVGDDVTYERKIREIIVTSRVERTLSKPEILELYLNSIYFGRNSWGVEMAARSYFGKSAKDLTLAEGALLAGLVKGPNYFNPDRYPDRAKERMAYVLNRMQEDGAIKPVQAKLAGLPPLVAHERPRQETAPYFADFVSREMKTVPGIEPLSRTTYTVRSTILPELQRDTEAALQEGLARYEMNTGRVVFEGPEANLAEAIKAIRAAEPSPAQKPDWLHALETAHLPLFDVHWTPAVLIDRQGWKVGLPDGRVAPLSGRADILKKLQLYDVVFVRLRDDKSKTARAELRVRPVVQGGALVLENKTGRILAMSGGFSYALSQLNRAAQTSRQPGSSIKPLTYLAALHKGLQPNTLVRDEPITLPPVGRTAGIIRDKDYWTPKNYDGGSSGVMTLRRALENSRNLATVGLLDGGIEASPTDSLERVCELAQEAQIYKDCLRLYPVVLGAQPVRMIDLAAFYAAIANEGARPKPHAIAAIEQDGRTIYRDDGQPMTWLGDADRVAFYQLKSMLQGVVQRGTAAAIRQLAPYVAGKTGTSDDENDAWFIGFTNDVTVAVWVGYDNNNGRRTLGGGQTGGKVAVPIFESIIKSAWAHHAKQAALSPPSAEAKRQMAALPVDLYSGSRVAERGERTIAEYFRLDSRGRLADTQYRIVTESDVAMGSLSTDDSYGEGGFRPFGQAPQYRPYPDVQPAPQPLQRGLFGLFGGGDRTPQPSYQQPYNPQAAEYERQRQRRIDPDYFWNSRRYN